MEQKGFHRKLTAILSAGVAGYNHLMQNDETATYMRERWIATEEPDTICKV